MESAVARVSVFDLLPWLNLVAVELCKAAANSQQQQQETLSVAWKSSSLTVCTMKLCIYSATVGMNETLFLLRLCG